MNYWKQFANMLGLELGQEFELVDSDSKLKYQYTYKIIEDGLYRKEANAIALYAEPSVTVDCILNGDYIVVKLPWKPKEGEQYCYYSKMLNHEVSRMWCGESFDLCLWKVGNCFKTEEEARTKGEEIMEQIQKEFEES